jgi:Zn-dependent protease
MLGRASLRLGSVRGIEIRVNVTWLAVFALLLYWLRIGYLAEHAPLLEGLAAWLVSVAGAVVLFCSVLAHELSHSLVALRSGLPIRRITLFIFGGVAHMESEPRSPGVELRMAAAGPVMSLAIAALLGAIRFGALAGDSDGAPAVVLEYATYANLVLAGFNLVPGYPLDGGRILRALIWKVTGDMSRATVIASYLGRVFGLLLVFVGVSLSVAAEEFGFLWLAFIGSFLERLAYMSAARARLNRRTFILRRKPERQGEETSATRHEGWYSET